MIDDQAFAALLQRAKRQGFLTTDNVREVAPIEQMSADEIATLMLRLEEAGAVVEIPDDLMGASRQRAPTRPQAPVIDLPAGQPPGYDANRPAPAPGVAPDAYTAPEPVAQPAPSGSDGWKFVLAAALVIAAGAIVVFLLAR